MMDETAMTCPFNRLGECNVETCMMGVRLGLDKADGTGCGESWMCGLMPLVAEAQRGGMPVRVNVKVREGSVG